MLFAIQEFVKARRRGRSRRNESTLGVWIVGVVVFGILIVGETKSQRNGGKAQEQEWTHACGISRETQNKAGLRRV